MKRGTTILAGALALILTCGAPAQAQAQEPTADQEIVEATTMLFDKLALLADGLGMDAPELPTLGLMRPGKSGERVEKF